MFFSYDYDSIGLERLFVVDPKQIIQSIELSYARYMYYKESGINIDMNNNFYLHYYLLSMEM